MAAIFLHQLADHTKSLRFQVGLLVVVGLFAASSAVHVCRFQRMADLAPFVQRDVVDRYAQAKDLNSLATAELRLLNERLPTEFMADGGASWFGDAFYLQAETGGGFDYSAASRFSNHWVRRYEVVDWTLLVRLVVSFLCVVLAYDSLSGERESGTLRLLLANPVSRVRVLAAKVGANLAVVLAGVAVGSLVSVLILTLSAAVPLTAGLVADWFLYLVGTAAYAAVFLLLATGVSALARTSGASLILLVLVWAVLVVVLPQTSYLIAVQSVEVNRGWKAAASRYVQVVRERLQQEGLEPRPRTVAVADGDVLEQRYLSQLADAEREGEALLKAQYARALHQYRVARGVSLISPGMAFQYAAEALLKTGLGKYEHFERQAWDYRQALRQFIRARDAADPDSPHLYFLPGFLSTRLLDLRDVPRFHEEPLPLASSLKLAWVPLLVIVGEVLAGIGFAVWAVRRMEV